MSQDPSREPQPGSPIRGPPHPYQEQVYLDASSDEEEQGPTVPAAVQEEAIAAADEGLSIYSVAAEPFRALLACIAQPPGGCLILVLAVTLSA